VRLRAVTTGSAHTRDYRTSRPVTYFALHRKGFIVPSARDERGGLLTPLFTLPNGAAGRYILCDTKAVTALLRRARLLGREPYAASCLWCPDFPLQISKRNAAFNTRLGIKELERLPGPKAKIPNKRSARSSRKSRLVRSQRALAARRRLDLAGNFQKWQPLQLPPCDETITGWVRTAMRS